MNDGRSGCSNSRVFPVAGRTSDGSAPTIDPLPPTSHHRRHQRPRRERAVRVGRLVLDVRELAGRRSRRADALPHDVALDGVPDLSAGVDADVLLGVDATGQHALLLARVARRRVEGDDQEVPGFDRLAEGAAVAFHAGTGEDRTGGGVQGGFTAWIRPGALLGGGDSPLETPTIAQLPTIIQARDGPFPEFVMAPRL